MFPIPKVTEKRSEDTEMKTYEKRYTDLSIVFSFYSLRS